jgi:hypothetical protein
MQASMGRDDHSRSSPKGFAATRAPEVLAENQGALLRILAEHEVQMVVVGGVGAQFHGWKSATADLDIAVDRSDDNVTRLNGALAEMGAGHPEYGQFGTAFDTKYGRLELVRKADGIGEYKDWLRNAGEKALEGGLTIVIANPDDILASKEAAGRDKDLAALDQMRKDFEAAGAESELPDL